MARRKVILSNEEVTEERILKPKIEKETKEVSSERVPVRRKPPKEVKIGREFLTRQDDIESDLFDAIEAVAENNKDFQDLIIDGVTKTIPKKLLRQINFALGQVLSNESYRYGNGTHTGIAEYGKINKIGGGDIQINPQAINGKLYYHSHIKTSLRELAKLAFGVENPTGEQYKEVNKALLALQNDGIGTKLDGAEEWKSLLWIEGRSMRDYKTQEQELSIILSPIYAMNAAINYALHPQDANKRIAQAVKQPTFAHYKLRDLLAMQDKRKPYRIYITTLLSKLGLADEYKKNKKRVMLQKLPKLFKAMVDIKLIKDIPTTETGIKGELEYCFIMDKNYTKPLKE